MPKSGALERRLFLFLDLFMAEQNADIVPYTAWWVLPYYNDGECPFGFFATDNGIRLCTSDEGFIENDVVQKYYECLSTNDKDVLDELKRADAIFKDDIKELLKSGCKISMENVNVDDYIFYDDPYAMNIQYENSNNDDYRELKETDFLDMLDIPITVNYASTENKSIRKKLFKMISARYILQEFNSQNVVKSSSLSRLVHVMQDILLSNHHLITFTKKEYMEKYNTNERQMARDIAVLAKFAVEKTVDKRHIYTLAVKRDDNYWEEWGNE